MKQSALTLTLLLSLVPAAVVAQEQPSAKPITDTERRAVIAELGRQLQAHYIFPDVAQRVAATLQKKESRGGYADATDTVALAEVLTTDLREQGKDLHFHVEFEPEFRTHPPGERPPQEAVPDPADIEMAARRGFGVESVQRLAGNVGYLEVRGFGPTELVGEAMSAAMLLLSGSDALILDLRRNHGGDPATVSWLLSHFFALGDQRHLNSIYSRADKQTQQYWTSNAARPRYIKPIYVLTSKETFSGGEECAYDLQTQKRATLVGETTGGGANPGDTFAVGEGFVAFIPNQQSINPITKTSWEHVGVKPDIAVPAADAQKVAHAAILRTLIAEASDAQRRAKLEAALAALEGEAAKPGR